MSASARTGQSQLSAGQVAIGLGSNLDQPLRQLRAALAALDQLPALSLRACSPFYGSAPIGPEQPNYVNAVALVRTALAPLALLDQLQAIEHRQRRVRGQRWGPRTLDLDILLIGAQRIDIPRLQVPHPRIAQRAFVLRPLAALFPALRLPGDRQLIAQRLAALDGQRIWPLAETALDDD